MVMADRMPRSGRIVISPPRPKPAPSSSGEFHAAANEFVGHRVKLAHLERIHSVIAADGQPVGGAELQQKLSGIDLHRGVGAGQSLDQRLLDAAAKPGFGFSIGHYLNLNSARTRKASEEGSVPSHCPPTTDALTQSVLASSIECQLENCRLSPWGASASSV